MRKNICWQQSDDLAPGLENTMARTFMDLRLRYVTAMGWLDARQSDADSYDATSSTWYFIRQSDGSADGVDPAIASALRATQVSSVYDSLTWSMLGSDAKRQADIIAANLPLLTEVNKAAALPQSGLWDITRLVSPVDGSVPATEVIRSIYELLGMVMFKTVTQPDADPVWMFLTTPTIKRLFEISGISCTVLFAGRINPGDADDAFLCVARPKRAWDRIGHSTEAAHRRAFEHVRKGASAMVEQTANAVVA